MNKYILILALLGCHTQSSQEKREQIEQDSIEAMVNYAHYKSESWVDAGLVFRDRYGKTGDETYLKMIKIALDSAMKWDSIEQQNLEKLK